MIALAHDGDLGRPAGDRRRRPRRGPGRGRALQPLQPGDGGGRRGSEHGRASCCSIRCSESIDRYALPAATEQLEVVAGELGERANVLGALALAIAQSGQAVAARIAGTVSAGMNLATRTAKREGEEEVMLRNRIWSAAAAVPLAMASIAAGCGDDDDDGGDSGGGGGGGEAGKVAVLLPDSKSSVRWETVDRPFLKKAFDAAGVDAEIVERRGRQVDPAAAGGAGDHERGEGHPAREPGLRLRRGDRGERQVPGREGDRLRPPDARHGRPGLLRLVRQRGRGQAPG